MSKWKFTPGPWRIGERKADCRIFAVSQEHAVARTYGSDLNGIGVCELTGERNKADARLIASAPEMLSLIERFLRIMSDSGGHPTTRESLNELQYLAGDAHTVLAQAEGQDSMDEFTLRRFEYWYADCGVIAIGGFIAPDDYIWDLKNCDDWKALFREGFEPAAAVARVFRSG